MKNIFWIVLLISSALFVSCDDDNTDNSKPTIDISKSEFQNCTVVTKGVPFTFTAEVSDNEALGSYSIDIHHNFDLHTHSTEAEVVECEAGEKQEATRPYKLIPVSKVIPNSPKTYIITETFTIPEEFQSGNYHFMIKVVDKSGWIRVKGLSFKVVDKKEEEKPRESIEIAKVHVIMHEGHLHGADFHGNPQAEKSPVQKRQDMMLVKTENGWKQEMLDLRGNIGENKPFVIPAGINLEHELTKNNPGTRYSVEFLFYDKEGNLLNEKFTQNAKQNQIFFTVDSYTENSTQKKFDTDNNDNSIFQYIYRDTNPSNKMYYKKNEDVTLLKKDDKEYGLIGLKGYFAMTKSRVSYKLNVHIAQWLKGNKGQNMDFKNVPQRSNSIHIDSFSLPLNVLIENGYGEKQQHEMFELLGKYFGLTAEEYEDVEIWGDYDPEGSEYWM